MNKRAQLLDRIAQSTWTLHIKGLEYQVVELDFRVEYRKRSIRYWVME